MCRVQVLYSMSREEDSCNKTRKLCEWIVAHAGEPRITKSSTHEKVLGTWLSKRRSKVKEGFVLPYKEQEILDSYGFTSLFEKTSEQVKSKSITHLYTSWVELHGREPSSSWDDLEQYLYRWMQRKRTGETRVFAIDIKIANNSVLPNIFDHNSRESYSNMMTTLVCDWVSKKGQIPGRAKRGTTERKLYNWLTNKRQGLKGNVKTKIYNSDLKIAESKGFPNIFT